MKRKMTTRQAGPVTPDSDPLFQTHATFEWEGTTYTKGTPVRIEGERGPFTFHYVSYNKDGQATVTVWHEGYHFRSFYADRIVGEGAARPGLCPIHPNYTAQRRPRSGCGTCYAAYEKAHPERVG